MDIATANALITGAWGHSLQRGTAATPLVMGSGGEAPEAERLLAFGHLMEAANLPYSLLCSLSGAAPAFCERGPRRVPTFSRGGHPLLHLHPLILQYSRLATDSFPLYIMTYTKAKQQYSVFLLTKTTMKIKR